MILDTNALTALAEGESAVAAQARLAPHISIPVIVLGEYRFGIAQSRHRKQYEQWLDGFLTTCKVLAITEETTFRYAEIRVELKVAGTPIPSNDLWIAALCRQHALPILTRDQHFELIAGLRRIDFSR